MNKLKKKQKDIVKVLGSFFTHLQNSNNVKSPTVLLDLQAELRDLFDDPVDKDVIDYIVVNVGKIVNTVTIEF